MVLAINKKLRPNRIPHAVEAIVPSMMGIAKFSDMLLLDFKVFLQS
jgi:hypothetical protein